MEWLCYVLNCTKAIKCIVTWWFDANSSNTHFQLNWNRLFCTQFRFQSQWISDFPRIRLKCQTMLIVSYRFKFIECKSIFENLPFCVVFVFVFCFFTYLWLDWLVIQQPWSIFRLRCDEFCYFVFFFWAFSPTLFMLLNIVNELCSLFWPIFSRTFSIKPCLREIFPIHQNSIRFLSPPLAAFYYRCSPLFIIALEYIVSEWKNFQWNAWDPLLKTIENVTFNWERKAFNSESHIFNPLMRNLQPYFNDFPNKYDCKRWQ